MSRASLDPSIRQVRDTTPGDGIALTDAAIGSRLSVVAVDQGSAAELAREGLLPGSRIEVVSRVPLGGPLIVTLGRVRLALGASAAGSVRAVPLREPAGDPVEAIDG